MASADATGASTALDDLRARSEAMIDELRVLVEYESPTGDVQRLDTLADVLVSLWEHAGATASVHRVDGVGAHLELRWPGPPGTPGTAAPVLLVGHYDTVHDGGGLDRNPWRIDEHGRAWGPGTQDMKSGLVIARHALAHLQRAGRAVPRPVIALITADEEIGSLTSSDLVAERARDAAYALVFEAGTSAGALKTSRKGVGLWTVTAHGRAAHAGQHFFDGRNANVALGALLPRIADLSDHSAGTTVNVGVVRGGTRANVVAARAEATIDVRFTTADEADRVGDALQALHADDGITLEVTGGVNRPAMQRTPSSAALFDRLRRHGRRLGIDVHEAAAGGASDGNVTAAAGAPTVDGLGGVGAGLHTDDEYVSVASLPDRAALIAALLSDPEA